jgi:hypothetical protein
MDKSFIELLKVSGLLIAGKLDKEVTIDPDLLDKVKLIVQSIVCEDTYIGKKEVEKLCRTFLVKLSFDRRDDSFYS